MRCPAPVTLIAVGWILCVLGWACGREPEPEPAADEWRQWRGARSLGVSPASALPVSWGLESRNLRWSSEVPGHGNSSPIVAAGKVFLTTAEAGEVIGQRPNGEEIREQRRSVLAFDLESGELLWRREIFEAEGERKHYLTSYAVPTPATDGDLLYVYFGPILVALDFEGDVAWQREVDASYAQHSRYGAASSPVLTEDTIILLQDREFADRESGWMAAFDKQTGEERWREHWQDTCCAYTTPSLWDRGAGLELIVAHSAFVVSYDPETGERLWHHPYPMLQLVPSVVFEDDFLLVTGGGNKERGTVGLQLDGAGKETKVTVLWETRQNAPKTSSPVLYQGRVFAVTERGVLTAYEARTGQVLWVERLARGNYRSSLVAGDGKIYIASERGVTSVVAAADGFELLAENDLGEGSNASPAVGGGRLLIRTRSKLFCIEADHDAAES